MLRAFLLLVDLLAVPATAQQFDPFQSATIIPRLGAQLPMDDPLVDQNGRATSLRELGGGRTLLLVPVLHQCPNLCEVTLAGVMDAVAAQPAKSDFAIVAFGIDPREGPAQARDDLAGLAKSRPRAPLGLVTAVTGPQRSLADVTGAIGYRYAWDPRIGQYAHAAATAVVSPDGRLSSWLYGVHPAPADLAKALANRSGGVMQQLILLCYHFDPQTGRYSLMIDRLVKAAAIATVLLLAALLVALKRRERAA